MIVLDTNVVSELMRPTPDLNVASWVAAVDGDEVFTTSVTAAEVAFGIARLPRGHRRNDLRVRWSSIRSEMSDRILAFDLDAADAYADIAAGREAEGRPIHLADAQIAAICRVQGSALATRNVRDFELLGLDLRDPFLP